MLCQSFFNGWYSALLHAHAPAKSRNVHHDSWGATSSPRVKLMYAKGQEMLGICAQQGWLCTKFIGGEESIAAYVLHHTDRLEMSRRNYRSP